MARITFDMVKAHLQKVYGKVVLRQAFKQHIKFVASQLTVDEITTLKQVMFKSKLVAPSNSYNYYKEQFKTLSKKLHPDLHNGIDPKFFISLGIANEQLKDKEEFLKGLKTKTNPPANILTVVTDQLNKNVYSGLFSQMIQDADYAEIVKLYDVDAAESMFKDRSNYTYSQRVASEIQNKVSEIAVAKIKQTASEVEGIESDDEVAKIKKAGCEAEDEDDITEQEINSCIDKLKLREQEKLGVEKNIKDIIEQDYNKFMNHQVEGALLGNHESVVGFLYEGYHKVYNAEKTTYCRTHGSVCRHPEILEEVLLSKVWGELLPDSENIFES